MIANKKKRNPMFKKTQITNEPQNLKEDKISKETHITNEPQV